MMSPRSLSCGLNTTYFDRKPVLQTVVWSLKDVGVYQPGSSAIEAEPYERLKVRVLLSPVALQRSAILND